MKIIQIAFYKPVGELFSLVYIRHQNIEINMKTKSTDKKCKFLWVMGEKAKIKKRNGSYYLVMDKKLALGRHLDKGGKLYAYGGYTASGRPVVLMYLDKKNMINKVEQD